MFARKLFPTLTLALAACLGFSARAIAQVETQRATTASSVSQLQIQNLPSGRSLDLVLQMDPKGGSTAVSVSQNGPVTLPPSFIPPSDPNTNVTYRKCKNGTVYGSGNGVKIPCAAYVNLGSSPWNQPFTIDAEQLVGPSSRPASTSESAYDRLFPSIDIGGGFSSINGYNPGLFRVGGDVGIQFAGILEAAPSFSYGYTGDATVLHFGSSGTGSTSFNSSLRSNEALLGGRVGVHPGPWSFTVFIGADVDQATLTDTSSFCGPTACGSSKTTSHLTTTNLVLGGKVSYDINDHFAVFADFDHVHEKPSAGSSSSLPYRYNVDKYSASFGFKYYPRKRHKKSR